MQRSEMLLEEVAGEQRAMFTCYSPSEAGHAQQGEAAAQPAGQRGQKPQGLLLRVTLQGKPSLGQQESLS